MSKISAEEVAMLEDVVDRCGLAAVLEALAGVCRLKAEAIRGNRDHAETLAPLAAKWSYAAYRVQNAATAPAVEEIS